MFVYGRRTCQLDLRYGQRDMSQSVSNTLFDERSRRRWGQSINDWSLTCLTGEVKTYLLDPMIEGIFYEGMILRNLRHL